VVGDLAEGETFTVGEHVLRWDGLDDAHGRVASGLYLFELQAGGKALARRELVIR